jgi:hypothetical protein
MPLDKTAIILKVVEILPNFIPRPKPPKTDYSELYSAIPKATYPPVQSPTLEALKIREIPIPKIEEEKPDAEERSIETTVPVGERKETSLEEVSTACLSCSRSHLSTVSGALGEAIRFARGDPQGILHPEAQRRILMAEDEINIMERIDLSPDALAGSPVEERAVAEEYLPRIRELRQSLGDINSFDKLEKVAGDASILSQEFRLRHLQLKGVDLNPVVELAKKVQKGELSMAEAKEQLKGILPEEE